eukprot:525430-Prorocentrum_minimum.AAC.1
MMRDVQGFSARVSLMCPSVHTLVVNAIRKVNPSWPPRYIRPLVYSQMKSLNAKVAAVDVVVPRVTEIEDHLESLRCAAREAREAQAAALQ